MAVFGLDVDTIASRFGAIDPHLPFPALPALSVDRIAELLPSAIIIAFLAGAESLLSALVVDRMDGTVHRSNTKVVAQGAANCVSALFGGLPASDAIARIATNIRAVAKTPVAGRALHSLFLLAFMMLAAPLASLLALAAVLVLTAWNRAKPQHFIDRMRT